MPPKIRMCGILLNLGGEGRKTGQMKGRWVGATCCFFCLPISRATFQCSVFGRLLPSMVPGTLFPLLVGSDRGLGIVSHCCWSLEVPPLSDPVTLPARASVNDPSFTCLQLNPWECHLLPGWDPDAKAGSTVTCLGDRWCASTAVSSWGGLGSPETRVRDLFLIHKVKGALEVILFSSSREKNGSELSIRKINGAAIYKINWDIERSERDWSWEAY